MGLFSNLFKKQVDYKNQNINFKFDFDPEESTKISELSKVKVAGKYYFHGKVNFTPQKYNGIIGPDFDIYIRTRYQGSKDKESLTDLMKCCLGVSEEKEDFSFDINLEKFLAHSFDYEMQDNYVSDNLKRYNYIVHFIKFDDLVNNAPGKPIEGFIIIDTCSADTEFIDAISEWGN